MPDLQEELTATAQQAINDANARDSLVFSNEDLAYEEDILRNPYSIKTWLRYIEFKRESKAPPAQVNMVYERALRELPGSYKLWYNYLRLRRKQVRSRCIIDPDYEAVNACFERSLVFMHKMPRIWYDYCAFLMSQRLVTRTRKTFDRALRALPITQHDRIWPLYIKFIKQAGVVEMSLRVYRRYMKLVPEDREEFVDFLHETGQLDAAALELAKIVNDEKFQSVQGKTAYQLWQDLVNLVSKNPMQVKSLPAEPLIRQGIKRYTDQVGVLWCSLAEYYIRAVNFERARDIYEEAIQTVSTARDFTQVFDAYAQFTERLVSTQMDRAAEDPSAEVDLEIDMLMARFEDLMNRRPLLLNSVLLRQNPHNVHEWHKRAQLYADMKEMDKVIETYTEAVQTVDPKQQTGKLHSLWIAFAKFYEDNKQLNDARTIFERAIKVPFARVDDLATVWCEYAEMELRNDNVELALRLMRRATTEPSKRYSYHDESEPAENRVYKSLKLWSMFADLEESFGTFESTKAVYDRIIDLRIATPQIIINYGLFLEENNHYEAAFRAYEKGVSLFKWPLVFDIWNTYLVKFTARYGGKKLERARDLFEQALERCPPKYAKNFVLMYAHLEEEHGLAQRAMSIYNKGTKQVDRDEMIDIYNVYISKAAEYYGVTKTRPIYAEAIEKLPEDKARDMCIRFAELERKLGEIDRARAIYAHCAQMCDPRLHAHFWDVWKDFEVAHGNEDTVREMLRIKRSVQVNFMAAQMLAAAGGKNAPTTVEMTAGDSMAVLEARAQQMAAEEELAQKQGKAGTSAATSAQTLGASARQNISFVRGDATATEREGIIEQANPDAIDLDQLEDESESGGESDDGKAEEASKEAQKIVRSAVPDEVFGSLAKERRDDASD